MRRSSLACAVLAIFLTIIPATHASLHEGSAELKEFLHKLQPATAQTSSRKLLGGSACVQYITYSADAYVGTCGGLEVKDESHWCDSSAVLSQCTYYNNYCGYGYTAYSSARTVSEFCVAESSSECCKPNGGAIAGIVIGLIVLIAGIVALSAWCCKCCCFRPKPVVMMAPAPQVIVVPAPTTVEK